MHARFQLLKLSSQVRPEQTLSTQPKQLPGVRVECQQTQQHSHILELELFLHLFKVQDPVQHNGESLGDIGLFVGVGFDIPGEAHGDDGG